MLGISRIAVYKRVKKGSIKAIKIGKIYAIPEKFVGDVVGSSLTAENKHEIDLIVKKIIAEYGQIYRLLG